MLLWYYRNIIELLLLLLILLWLLIISKSDDGDNNNTNIIILWIYYDTRRHGLLTRGLSVYDVQYYSTLVQCTPWAGVVVADRGCVCVCLGGWWWGVISRWLGG